MLDDCDYYILILAGRYGSVDSDGIGFTEKEYDYAISKGIPIMSFVMKDTEKLPSGKCENTDVGRSLLQEFRSKVCKGKLVKFYHDIGSLQAAAVISLYQCIKDYPAKGWVRGDSIDFEKDTLYKLKEYMEQIIAAEKETKYWDGTVIIT